MSRTDKDAPEWVRALHAHQDGEPTGQQHSWTCEEYNGPFARNHEIRRVLRTDAEANGWIVVTEHLSGAEHVYARVPHGPFPCDLDTSGSRCYRWVADRHRWYCYAPPTRERLHLNYFGPERAAVRDALREAVKEYNATGEVDTEPPTRQTRSSDWNGGWWD